METTELPEFKLYASVLSPGPVGEIAGSIHFSNCLRIREMN